jgi:hypothetical protein
MVNLINRMDESLTMEIKDNAFARQFETTLEDELISVEYFSREKIFLTKINTPESFSDEASLINSYRNHGNCRGAQV